MLLKRAALAVVFNAVRLDEETAHAFGASHEGMCPSFVYSGEQRKEGTKVGKCVVKLAKPGHQAELVHEQAILKQLNSSESLECRCALVEVRAHRVGAGTQ